MSGDSLEIKVKEIVAEQLGLSVDDVALDAAFSGDLGADVLDKVELVMAFEEEFDMEIDDEDVENLRTPQDVIDFVGSRSQ